MYSPMAIMRSRKLSPTALVSTSTSVSSRGLPYASSVAHSNLSNRPGAAMLSLRGRPASFMAISTDFGFENLEVRKSSAPWPATSLLV